MGAVTLAYAVVDALPPDAPDWVLDACLARASDATKALETAACRRWTRRLGLTAPTPSELGRLVVFGALEDWRDGCLERVCGVAQ